MEATEASWFFNPDVWEEESFMFNETTNITTVHTVKMSPVIDKAINFILITVLTITMVSMGCTMEVSKIKKHILKPKGVSIAALAQYGVMPLTAFSLAKAFQLSEIKTVVVLICGCCPGGTVSNILALALQGDMNLSIVMTVFSTVLALGMMPLLLYLYCQGFPNVQKAVPFTKIMISLAMLLIPCSIGIAINHYWPKYSKYITRAGIILLMITVVVVSVLSSVGIGESILSVLSPSLMAISVIMPFIGYTFGFIISLLFRLSPSECRTVSMETGCQNIQLCSTILKLAFPQEVIGPLFLFPMVFASIQLIEAAVLIILFRGHQIYMLKKTGVLPDEKYKPANTEEIFKEPIKERI